MVVWGHPVYGGDASAVQERSSSDFGRWDVTSTADDEREIR